MSRGEPDQTQIMALELREEAALHTEVMVRELGEEVALQSGVLELCEELVPQRGVLVLELSAGSGP